MGKQNGESGMTPLEIKNALQQTDLNQAAIARALGLNPSFISRVIDGHCVSLRVHEAIAEAIGVDIRKIWPDRYLHTGKVSKRGRPAKNWNRQAA